MIESLSIAEFKVGSLESLLKIISKNFNVGQKDLLTQTLLHLPRLTDDQLKDQQTVTTEISRLADRILQTRKEYEHLERPPKSFKFENLSVEWIEEDLARIIHEKFHYIGRFRKNSLHIGIFLSDSGEKRLAGLTTFSDFDQVHIEKYLPADLEGNKVRTVSRIYSFDWVPKNFASYMIGKAIRAIKNHQPDIKMLITYLNPNLKFNGTIYKASNWNLFAKEEIQKYAYLDSNYITLRALQEDYDMTDLDLLQDKLRDRLTFSLQALEPLQIFGYITDKRSRQKNTVRTDTYFITKNPPIV